VKLNYLLLIIFLGISNISYSQEIKEAISVDMPCYTTKDLFKTLREKYKELPLLTGKADDEANSTMSIWLNPIDNYWTIIATKKDLSCVVGTGTDMKIIPVRKGTSI
jgi:hypothetical protein